MAVRWATRRTASTRRPGAVEAVEPKLSARRRRARAAIIPAMPGSAPLLLLSMPQMADPNFSRTVVLLCDYTTEGAFGLVVNRQMAEPAWTMVKTEPPIPVDRDLRLWLGGPVDPQKTWVLMAESHGPEDEQREICPGVLLSVSHALTMQLLQTPPTSRARVVVGYAGWGPGPAGTGAGDVVVADDRRRSAADLRRARGRDVGDGDPPAGRGSGRAPDEPRRPLTAPPAGEGFAMIRHLAAIVAGRAGHGVRVAFRNAARRRGAGRHRSHAEADSNDVGALRAGGPHGRRGRPARERAPGAGQDGRGRARLRRALPAPGVGGQRVAAGPADSGPDTARPRPPGLLPPEQGAVVASRSQPAVRHRRTGQAAAGQLLRGRRDQGRSGEVAGGPVAGRARAGHRLLHHHPPRAGRQAAGGPVQPRIPGRAGARDGAAPRGGGADHAADAQGVSRHPRRRACEQRLLRQRHRLDGARRHHRADHRPVRDLRGRVVQLQGGVRGVHHAARRCRDAEAGQAGRRAAGHRGQPADRPEVPQPEAGRAGADSGRQHGVLVGRRQPRRADGGLQPARTTSAWSRPRAPSG